LTVNDFMRIVVVDITPEPGEPLIVINGKNGAGKSSAVNAIWCALGGEAVVSKLAPGDPVNKGAEQADIRLDLGDLVVTRKFKAADVEDEEGNVRRVYRGSELVVTNADGSAEYNSPQRMLDGLVGRFTLDPLAFSTLDATKQRDVLLDLCGLRDQLDALDARRLATYQKRTKVNAVVDAIAAQIAGIDAPDERPEAPDVEAILEERGRRMDAHEKERKDVDDANAVRADMLSRIQSAVSKRDQTNRVASATQEEIDALERQLGQKREALAETQRRLGKETAKVGRLENALQETPEVDAPEIPDCSDLDEQIKGAEGLREQARLYDEREEKRKELVGQNALADELSASIKSVDADKVALVEAADLPVPGLGFDENGVTWDKGDGNGPLPLAQHSSADRLLISCKVAMHGDHHIRVLRIDDGEKLDGDNLALVGEEARAAGYQVFVTRVGESSEFGVLIQDGEVVGAGE
jgi:DNA repair ATPase RecN